MARNVLITGGNSGIGKAMARALAAEGDRVIIASRDLAKSEQAATDIVADAPTATIEAMALDLGEFAAIDRFAAELVERMPVIDVLVLNAGLYTHRMRKLDNGLEAMIGVMHFGHFRLVQKLLDAVVAADEGRIIVTSSLLHRFTRIRKASFNDPSRHRLAVGGYAQAKLANLLFTRELALRLGNTDVTVNVFHPGAVATGIWQELPGFLQKWVNPFLVNPEKAADTAIWLATAPQARRYSGEYFVNRRIATSSAASRDAELAAWLWQASEARMPKAT